jgi:hypothetical protein
MSKQLIARGTHRIACELFEKFQPSLGIKSHTLVGDVCFFLGDDFGTFVKCPLGTENLNSECLG